MLQTDAINFEKFLTVAAMSVSVCGLLAVAIFTESLKFAAGAQCKK